MAWGLHIFGFMIIVALQTTGVRAFAEDMESLDAEVEESMLDSDATSAQAKLMREHQMRIKLENERDRKKAAELRQKAAVKQREAKVELKTADAAVKKLLEERRVLRADIRRSNELLAKSEVSIKAARENLAKTKLDNETLRSLKEAQQQRLEKNHQYLARLQKEQLAASQEQTRSKADWERLKTMTEESDRKISSAQKALPPARVPAAQAEPAEKKRAPASTRRMLAHDCRVYEQPNANAKVLGIKRSGSSVSAGPATDEWVSVQLLKRTLYVRSDCF